MPVDGQVALEPPSINFLYSCSKTGWDNEIGVVGYYFLKEVADEVYCPLQNDDDEYIS